MILKKKSAKYLFLPYGGRGLRTSIGVFLLTPSDTLKLESILKDIHIYLSFNYKSKMSQHQILKKEKLFFDEPIKHMIL